MVEDRFEGFEGIIPEQRYRNSMLYHARKQTELMEKLVEQNAQLLPRSDVKEVPNTEKEVNGNGTRSSGRGRNSQR